MSRFPLFFRWLTIAALADWLITRTITRTAIFMPKPPQVVAAYQALTLIGQLAFTLTGLLALAAVFWIAWQSRRSVVLPFVLLSLAVFSIASVFVAPGGWLAVGYQLLVMVAVGIVGKHMWQETGGLKNKIAWSAPALALMLGGLYQLLPALYTALRWPGPPPLTETLFNLGELFVVLTPIVLWWAVGRASRVISPYKWAAIPVLAFVVAYLANPAMTAIIAIWSTGLTLYLPWPLYAVSLWLAGVTVIAALRQGNPTGWAMLLLIAGGYTPQLSAQVFLGLIALWSFAVSDPQPAFPLRQLRLPIPVAPLNS
ncbi:MAG: hypothetical protein HYZ49_20595 [Chloroflexi bacterium]|nr:hypothetical protein [Chloroflexota bacterium]